MHGLVRSVSGMTNPTSPKYPDITVELVGQDGNPMSVIGRVRAALRTAGVPTEQINEFSTEATSGSYADVITTACRWVAVS